MLESKDQFFFFSNPEERELIGRRGVSLVDELLFPKQSTVPELLFFLDKSARPLASFLKQIATLKYPHLKFPQAFFLNFGTEKKLNSIFQLTNLQTEDDVVNIFGKEQVNYLKKLLHPEILTTKAIIDDIFHTGLTRDSLCKITTILDPHSYYLAYQFLDPEKINLRSFVSEHNYAPALPWHNYFTLVAEPTDSRSFTAQRNTNTHQRNLGMLVRNELKTLAHQAVKNKTI